MHGLEANLFLAPGEGDSIPESEKSGSARPDGAGVVADSTPSREYDETLEKASAMFAAIERAEAMS